MYILNGIKCQHGYSGAIICLFGLAHFSGILWTWTVLGKTMWHFMSSCFSLMKTKMSCCVFNLPVILYKKPYTALTLPHSTVQFNVIESPLRQMPWHIAENLSLKCCACNFTSFGPNLKSRHYFFTFFSVHVCTHTCMCVCVSNFMCPSAHVEFRGQLCGSLLLLCGPKNRIEVPGLAQQTPLLAQPSAPERGLYDQLYR